MKRIKTLSVALTILFVGLTSTKTSSSSFSGVASGSSWLYMWFEYDGCGDPYDPQSYWPMLLPPYCDSEDGYLCAIYAEADALLLFPSEYGLWELGMESSSFTERYCGWSGEVILREY
jgi:hypothetical protein